MMNDHPKGGPDRRQVLLGGAATALALGLPAGAMAQDAPKQGGHLRLGLTSGNTADQGDPATWGTSALVNLGLWGAVYNNLTEIGRTGRPSPSSPRRSSRRRTPKPGHSSCARGDVPRRQDARCDDVVASINHHRGPDTKSAAKAIVGAITEIKADGKDTVIVTLQSGSADFPTLCTDYIW